MDVKAIPNFMFCFVIGVCVVAIRVVPTCQPDIQSNFVVVMASVSAMYGLCIFRAVNAAGTDFELDVKYEMIKPIGHGAYGVVISALDHESNSKVR